MDETRMERTGSISTLSVKDRMKLWKTRDDKNRSPSVKQATSRPSSRRPSGQSVDGAASSFQSVTPFSNDTLKEKLHAQAIVIDGNIELSPPKSQMNTSRSNEGHPDDFIITELKAKLQAAQETIESLKENEHQFFQHQERDKQEINTLHTKINELNQELIQERKLYIEAYSTAMKNTNDNNNNNNNSNNNGSSVTSSASSTQNHSLHATIHDTIQSLLLHQNNISMNQPSSQSFHELSTTLFTLRHQVLDLIALEETVHEKNKKIHELESKLQQINKMNQQLITENQAYASAAETAAVAARNNMSTHNSNSHSYNSTSNNSKAAMTSQQQPSHTQNTISASQYNTANTATFTQSNSLAHPMSSTTPHSDVSQTPQPTTRVLQPPRRDPPVRVVIDEEDGKLRIMISKAKKKIMFGEYSV